MLTAKDIQKLISAAEKVFATKEDLTDFKEGLRKDFSRLETSVDTYAKKADTYFQEMLMLGHKVDRHERWILQIAEKVGVDLEY